MQKPKSSLKPTIQTSPIEQSVSTLKEPPRPGHRGSDSRRSSGISLNSAPSSRHAGSRTKVRLSPKPSRIISGLDVSQEKKDGTHVHFAEKDRKYYYEEKSRSFDPFYHVDVATDCETYFVGQKARSEYKHSEHFAYIVDLDNYEYHKVVFHSFINEILQSAPFRHGILFLVMVNAVLIGLATLPYLQDYESTFELLDMIILSVFIFEVIIKWIYDFRLFWYVSWNILDFSIISLTLLASVVPVTSQGDSTTIVVRVVRAFRSLRCVSSMTSLSIVTHTVIKSGLDMGNILLVLLIIMLVLSVMAVILFDFEDLTPQRFLNALDAWTVLFICVTQDGWAEVLNGYDRQSKYFALLALYLIFAVSIGAFIFANLIIAVIVANLELSVKELRDEMKLHDNPLEYQEGRDVADIEIIPVYDLLAKNNFVCVSQRPLRIPKLKKVSTRKMQVYTSLIVALEQNMLEAEIINLDMEKIIAVILSIVVQIEANTKEVAKREQNSAEAQKILKATEAIRRGSKLVGRERDGRLSKSTLSTLASSQVQFAKANIPKKKGG